VESPPPLIIVPLSLPQHSPSVDSTVSAKEDESRQRKTEQNRRKKGRKKKWALKTGMKGARETQGKGTFP